MRKLPMFIAVAALGLMLSAAPVLATEIISNPDLTGFTNWLNPTDPVILVHQAMHQTSINATTYTGDWAHSRLTNNFFYQNGNPNGGTAAVEGFISQEIALPAALKGGDYTLAMSASTFGTAVIGGAKSDVELHVWLSSAASPTISWSFVSGQETPGADWTGIYWSDDQSPGGSSNGTKSGTPTFANISGGHGSLTGTLPVDATYVLVGLETEYRGSGWALVQTVNMDVTGPPPGAPLPGTLMLLGSGLAGLGVCGWRKRS